MEERKNDVIEISIIDILKIIKNNLFVIILITIATGLLGFFYIKTTPSSYSSKCVVLISPLSENSSLSSLLSSGSSSSSVSTEVELASSKALVTNALQMLDLSKYTSPEGVKYSTLNEQDSNFLSIDSLQKKITVDSTQNTRLLSFEVTDTSADFAADFANALGTSFLKLLGEISKQSKSAQVLFLENQIEENNSSLEKASDDLLKFRNENNMTQQSANAQVLTNQIGELALIKEPLLIQLNQASEDCKDYQQYYSLVSDFITEYKETVKEELLYNNVSADSSRLYTLSTTLSLCEKNIEQKAGKQAGLCLYLKAKIDVISELEEQYSKKLSDYEVLAMQLEELTAQVELYQSLSLNLNELLAETKMLEAAQVDNGAVIDKAYVSDIPVSPKKLTIMAISVFIGLCLGSLIVVVLSYMYPFITKEEQVAEIMGSEVPKLASVPYSNSIQSNKNNLTGIAAVDNPNSFLGDRFSALASNFLFSITPGMKVFSLTSELSASGKTTMLINLAGAVASIGKKVLIIDCDLRKPSLESALKIKKQNLGLTDILLAGADYKKAIVRPVSELEDLHLLTAGHTTKRPSVVLSSQSFKDFVQELKKHYDLIFIDCCPISLGSDFYSLSHVLDAYVLIVRAGLTTKTSLEEFKEDKNFSSAQILGYVFNGALRSKSSNKNSGYGYSYGYGYGYGYGYNKDDKSTETKKKSKPSEYRKIRTALENSWNKPGERDVELAYGTSSHKTVKQKETTTTGDFLSEIENDTGSKGKK